MLTGNMKITVTTPTNPTDIHPLGPLHLPKFHCPLTNVPFATVILNAIGITHEMKKHTVETDVKAGNTTSENNVNRPSNSARKLVNTIALTGDLRRGCMVYQNVENGRALSRTRANKILEETVTDDRLVMRKERSMMKRKRVAGMGPTVSSQIWT